MEMRELILLRGLPGSGKSTLAKAFGGVHLEADMFFMKDGEYKFNFDDLRLAHAWCHNKTQQAMIDHEPIIVVSNTFTMEWELESYYSLAEIHKYRVHSVIVENRHGSENIHGCPPEKVKIMKDRFQVRL